jgi:uncharacterized protein (TIGR00369 family)
MTVDELNAFLRAGFPHGTPPTVLAADATGARCRMAFHESQLRPGETVSGPTMMALADTVAYVWVLAAIGFQPLAVTTSLNMNFLRKAGPNSLIAEARKLKLGRTLAVCDVVITPEGQTDPCAQAAVTYAIPGKTKE